MDTLATLICELEVMISTFGRRWRGKRAPETGQYERPEVHRICAEAVRQLRRMQKRWEADEFVAAFVGLSKVGKSTLLNAIFGQEITPRRATPMTQVPIEFRYGEKYAVTIFYKGTYHRQTKTCANAQELRSLLEQYATEGGEHATGDVKCASASVPADLLKGGLVIADTPGFGAAQIWDKEGTHNRALIEYLPSVQQVFWVILFEQAITKHEADFYRTYLQETCNDVVLTGCDEITETDKKRYRRWAETHLGLSFLRFHYLSGKKALEAKLSNDPTELERSGLLAFEERLQQMATRESRRPLLVEDLICLCADFGCWARKQGLAPNPWPPVEWKRVLYTAKQIRLQLSDAETDRAGLDAVLEQCLTGGA